MLDQLQTFLAQDNIVMVPNLATHLQLLLQDNGMFLLIRLSLHCLIRKLQFQMFMSTVLVNFSYRKEVITEGDT